MPSEGKNISEYTRLQKWLYWAVVVPIALQYLAFGDIAQVFGQGLDAGELPYTAVAVGHIVSGVLVLLLSIWRLGLRLRHGPPPPPDQEPWLARLGAKATHLAFYALLFLMPLTGLAAWFVPSERMGEIHDLGQLALLYLMSAHVLAVLVHQLWWRTGLISRMT